MISTISMQTYQDVNGVPYSAGAKLVILKAGTQQASVLTFADEAMLYPRNEFELDSRGTCQVYCPVGTEEDIYLYDNAGKLISSWLKYPMTSGSGGSGGSRYLGSMSPVALTAMISQGLTQTGDWAVMNEAGSVVYPGGTITVVAGDEVIQQEGDVWAKKPYLRYGLVVSGEEFRLVGAIS